MTKGWIKLPRDWLDIIAELTPEQVKILLTLLLRVSYKSRSWIWGAQGFCVQPGQGIFSLESIARAAGKGITVAMVRTALAKFVSLGLITDQSTKTGRLITFVDWEIWQSCSTTMTVIPADDQQTVSKEFASNKNEEEKEIEKERTTTTCTPSRLAELSSSGQFFEILMGGQELREDEWIFRCLLQARRSKNLSLAGCDSLQATVGLYPAYLDPLRRWLKQPMHVRIAAFAYTVLEAAPEEQFRYALKVAEEGQGWEKVPGYLEKAREQVERKDYKVIIDG